MQTHSYILIDGSVTDALCYKYNLFQYTYAPAAQLITFDGYADANTHTQV